VPTLRGKCLSVVRPIRSESVASGFGASVSCFTEFSLPYPVPERHHPQPGKG